MGHHLDGSADRCQPCSSFRSDGDPTNVHECLAPFDGKPLCTGKVSFCLNCKSDHHHGGYNTCGAVAVRGCARNHPKCAEVVQIRQARVFMHENLIPCCDLCSTTRDLVHCADCTGYGDGMQPLCRECYVKPDVGCRVEDMRPIPPDLRFEGHI